MAGNHAAGHPAARRSPAAAPAGAALTANRARAKLARMPYQSGRAIEELAAFVAVVDANGFTAAARRTGARKATLSQRVQDLEARLGATLLVRTTRSLRLTDEGRAYLELARRALDAVRDADGVVAASKSKPTGLLRVTAQPALAGQLLEGVVVPYLAKYPEVSVELDPSTRRVDLLREPFDVAVRLGHPGGPSLLARKLGVALGGYYASPRYLARRGVPARPEGLAAHDVIVVPRGAEPTPWPFVEGPKKFSVAVRPRLSVGSFELAARAAAAGAGIVRSPRHFVAAFLETKQLVPVLEAWAPPGSEVYAVFPPGGALAPKTRAFLDALATWFRRAG
jgi:LysR family transcriptional regulator, regulator for bpeEF and oprC